MFNQYVNIFVYGTLKKGYPNHHVFCKNTTRIIPCEIKGTMYDTKLGFPALQLRGDYNIKGQLITVPKRQLILFDYLQGVPRLYQRQVVEIQIDGVLQNAYVYTMKFLPVGATIVENGNW